VTVKSRERSIRLYAVHHSELTSQHIDKWSSIQRAENAFESPFFRPEFTNLAGKVWRRTEVGIIERDGIPVGFLPFERDVLGIAKPVAASVSDFEGIITHPDMPISAQQLVADFRLSYIEFNHLIASQAVWAPYHVRTGPSPSVDLASGYETYHASRYADSGYRKLIRELERKAERLQQDCGSLRVEFECQDTNVFDWLVHHKAQQYVNKGHANVLTVPGVLEFLRSIQQMNAPFFAGMLSALFAGDRLIAAHMGMRSESVWHYWFPVYDESFSKYSPGLLLLMRMIQKAPTIGMRKIDLGKGDALYKQRLANTEQALAQARIGRNGLLSGLTRSVVWARQKLRRTPWAVPLRHAYRRLFSH
jgi:CelD/BcsL family acetyltransferase involved in cellulose biosynthesis